MRIKLSIPKGSSGEIIKFAAKPWCGPAHSHDELELNLVIRGSAVYMLQSRRLVLCPDAMVWLFPGQDHLLLHQSPDFEMWVAVFKQTLVRYVCARVRGSDATTLDRQVLRVPNPPGHFSRIVPHPSANQLSSLCGLLFNQTIPARDRNAGMMFLLTSSWREYSRASDVPEQSDVHPAVERAAFLLRDDPGRFDLPTLAREAGASPAWLSRLFQRHMGMSITEFRNRQRVSRFLQIYTSVHRQNLLTAALQAGFNSYPQFYRVFQQFVGTTPAAYRRALNKDAGLSLNR